MGHASKKKKKGGGSGRRNKGRAQLKEHSSDSAADNELLSEEITVLYAFSLFSSSINYCAAFILCFCFVM